MKVLFIHQNFPGQFLHLAPALAQLWKQYWETVLNKYRVKAQVPQGLFEYLGPCFGLKSATQNSSKWPQPHAACNAQHAQARAHNVAATL